MSQPIGIALTLIDAYGSSLKRLAWAYGCARKGTSEERQLEMLLLQRAAADVHELACTWATLSCEALAENAVLRIRIEELELRLEEIRQDAMERDL